MKLLKGVKIVTDIPGPISSSTTSSSTQFYLGGIYPDNETVFPVVLRHGEGSLVEDVDGNVYIDFSFGLNVSLGHAHPKIVKSAVSAFSSLANASNYTTLARSALAKKLLSITGNHFGGVQFYSAGTEAVEAGIWFLRKISGQSKILSFFGSYHGKTHGAISLAVMKSWHGQRFPAFYRVSYGDIKVIEKFFKKYKARDFAGIILEPIQGEGVVIPPNDYLTKVCRFCNSHGILLMVDEILTGLGRCGVALVSLNQNIVPDIVTVGKCLGNGMPISAVLIRRDHIEKVKEILGSTTYGGNPLSTSIALETLTVLEEENTFKNAQDVEKILWSKLKGLTYLTNVKDVRGKGCLFGIELRDRKLCLEIAQKIMKHGVLTTAIAKTLRLTPAVNIPKTLVVQASDIITKIIRERLQ